MGYNTVVFLLNDFMGDIKRSPHAAAWAISHPPLSDDSESLARWKQAVIREAEHHAEPRIHPQAIEVLPTCHADYSQWLVAGGNCITRLGFVRYGTTKDKKLTVTLELPEWWPHHPRNRHKYR